MEIIKIVGIYLGAFVVFYISIVIATALTALILQLLNIPIVLFLRFVIKVDEIFIDKWIDKVKFAGVFAATPIALIPIIFIFKYFGSLIPLLFFVLVILFKILLWSTDFIDYQNGGSKGDLSRRYMVNEVASLILALIIYFLRVSVIWFWGV